MVKHTVAQTNNILFNKYSQLETAATGIGAVICDNQQYCSFWKQLLQLLRRLPGCYCISYIRTGQYVSLKEEQRTTMEAFLDGIYDFTLLSTNICKSYFYQLALLAVPLSSCWSVCLKLTPWETVIDCLFAQSSKAIWSIGLEGSPREVIVYIFSYELHSYATMLVLQNTPGVVTMLPGLAFFHCL